MTDSDLIGELTKEPTIAYFSMEIGVQNDIPTYSGGLGVLAGDTIRSSADLKLPMIAVTLMSRKGYFTQELDSSGRQTEQPVLWDPAQYMKLLPHRAVVQIEGHDVYIQAWLFMVKSLTGGCIPFFSLTRTCLQTTRSTGKLPRVWTSQHTVLLLRP